LKISDVFTKGFVMKIVIIGAMEQEITLLKAQINHCETQQVAYLSVFTGSIGDNSVYLVQCGIGKVASAAAAALLIHAFEPDAVINTGSAGGFDPKLNIGDVVIATSLLYHDVDVTHFGYALGQVPRMPAFYESNSHLVNLAQNALAMLPNIQVKTGLVCSGDSFVGSDEAAGSIKTNFPTMAAVEMEGAAIAQVCHLMQTPFVVIRSLSDIAGKTSTVSFDEYLETAATNSATLVLDIVKNCH
jgi:adenosylhomocysteine nucleosidase